MVKGQKKLNELTLISFLLGQSRNLLTLIWVGVFLISGFLLKSPINKNISTPELVKTIFYLIENTNVENRTKKF